MKVALRTQQVLAEETNIKQTADPLGGSWFIEKLTDEIEAEANAIFDEIDEVGGVIAAVDRGYFRRRIAESALQQSEAFDSGEAVVVGVNKYVDNDYQRIPILKIDKAVEAQQVARLKQLKQDRDAKDHRDALKRLRQAALDNENVMPHLIAAAQANATVGEMMDTMADVFGRYDGGPEW